MAELNVDVPKSEPKWPCPSCAKESKAHTTWSDETQTGDRICVTRDCPGGEGPDGRTIFEVS